MLHFILQNVDLKKKIRNQTREAFSPLIWDELWVYSPRNDLRFTDRFMERWTWRVASLFSERRTVSLSATPRRDRLRSGFQKPVHAAGGKKKNNCKGGTCIIRNRTRFFLKNIKYKLKYIYWLRESDIGPCYWKQTSIRDKHDALCVLRVYMFTLVSSADWTSLFLLPAYIICCSGLQPV